MSGLNQSIKMKRYLTFILFGVLLIVPQVRGGSEEGGLPGGYLRWGASARCLALGGAFVGLADDASAVYWNPAGLEQIPSTQILAMHATLFERTSYDLLAVVQPTRRLGTFGFGGVWLSSGSFERTDEQNRSQGHFSDLQSTLLLSYAKELGKVSAGLNFKLVGHKIAGYSGSGTGLDFSLTYRPLRNLNFGLSLQNLLQPKLTLIEEEESFPRCIRFGQALRFLNRRLVLVTDLEKVEGQELKVYTGMEYWVFSSLALRGGYDGKVREYSLGSGFRLSRYQVDYSMMAHELGISHRFSFIWRFGIPYGVKLRPSPKLFSPTGRVNQVKMRIKTWEKHPMEDWRLIIEDQKGNVVKKYQGDENPPQEIVWNGQDDLDRTVGDGLYKVKVLVRDKFGDTWEDSDEVRVVNFKEERKDPIRTKVNRGD